MAIGEQDGAQPEGVFSLLDTDLYKLTMQSAVLKYFAQVEVTYGFTNRTPAMKLSRRAVKWLQGQIDLLANITVTPKEMEYLKSICTFLSDQYLHYISTFRLRPSEHVHLSFHPEEDTGSDDDRGDIELSTSGLWVDTILYEIPLLALISEAYFKFCDRDWTYDGQLESARDKGLKMLEHGCVVSEFGSRRRRDYHTHELVLQGLLQAQEEATKRGYKGKLAGTSNVHFAMRMGIAPIGTVAHEWFMGVAAVTQDYARATETALNYWIGTFGKGVLAVALTDTFGTPAFLRAFSRKIPPITTTSQTLPSTGTTGGLTTTDAPIKFDDSQPDGTTTQSTERFADVFTGVRQDSGDPLEFIQTMREYYDREGPKDAKRTIVFSDSLNVEKCIEYKDAADKAGFNPSFGVGTFLTNDFQRASDGKKSVPLNIVIKLSSANGQPAIKISDNIGKNTGDSETVKKVKQQLGYVEHEWAEGDESTRWGKANT